MYVVTCALYSNRGLHSITNNNNNNTVLHSKLCHKMHLMVYANLNAFLTVKQQVVLNGEISQPSVINDNLGATWFCLESL